MRVVLVVVATICLLGAAFLDFGVDDARSQPKEGRLTAPTKGGGDVLSRTLDMALPVIESTQEGRVADREKGKGEVALSDGDSGFGDGASGFDREAELRGLNRCHEAYIEALKDPNSTNAARFQAVQAELVLARKSVAVIMKHHGRANYVRDRPEGFVLKTIQGTRMFAADEAKFKFRDGEFPAFDRAEDQYFKQLHNHDAVPVLDDGQELAIEDLYLEAVEALTKGD